MQQVRRRPSAKSLAHPLLGLPSSPPGNFGQTIQVLILFVTGPHWTAKQSLHACCRSPLWKTFLPHIGSHLPGAKPLLSRCSMRFSAFCKRTFLSHNDNYFHPNLKLFIFLQQKCLCFRVFVQKVTHLYLNNSMNSPHQSFSLLFSVCCLLIVLHSSR